MVVVAVEMVVDWVAEVGAEIEKVVRVGKEVEIVVWVVGIVVIAAVDDVDVNEDVVVVVVDYVVVVVVDYVVVELTIVVDVVVVASLITVAVVAIVLVVGFVAVDVAVVAAGDDDDVRSHPLVNVLQHQYFQEQGHYGYVGNQLVYYVVA
jgi:hypothetical protein